MVADTLFDEVAQSGALPVELTSFVARRDELTQIRTLLAGSRLVTLIGAGGVGKTRLAVRAVTELRRTAPDAVWFVDLASLHDPALLAQTVAGAMRLVPAPGRTALEALADYIAGERVLLVLDNCEHLLDECAQLAGRLLRDCPRLRILATSREPLGMTGEAVVLVAPMTVPEPGAAIESVSEYEAVALFARRAEDAYAGFVVSPATLPTIGEICYRLDGLPLAIELAAVRLRTLSLSQLLERLSDPYRLLTGGGRSLPQRQRTLRASIEWSYDLCTPAERTVWARLSVFAGGCELDAAEGVCSGGDVESEDVLDILQSLVDKSIVVRTERADVAWFRMLETIHEFGARQLAESGEADLVSRRHRDWYEQLLARAEADWVSPRQRYWLARMYREIANLRAVLGYSLSQGASDPAEAGSALRVLIPAWRICWWALGRLEELRTWLERALEQSPESTVLRGRALLIRAYMAAIQRRPELGVQDLDEGRAIAERLGDRAGISLAAATEGMAAAEARGDVEAGIVWYQKALAELGAGSDLGRRLNLLALLASGYDRVGDASQAMRYRDEAIALSEQHGELFERGYLLFVLGVSAWSRGDLDRAEELVRECLRLKRELGDPVGAALAVQHLASIAASAGRFDRAAFLLGASQIMWRQAGTVAASFPSYQKLRDASALQAQQALGTAAYELEFARGTISDPDAVVGFALDERPAMTPRVPTNPLTAREQEIAELVAKGLTNREIAARLVIAVRTAEGHVERVRNKLGFSSRTQVVAWVMEHPEFSASS